MKKSKRSFRLAAAAVVAGALGVMAPAITSAAVPTVAQDDGAYVRLVGNPTDGTAKFQYGWSASTPASAAAGYWVGLYDVTNSHYEWSFDTGAVDLPDQFFRNARPTAELPNGDYKVVFFLRATYGPTTNIAEIEFPFSVANSTM
ncbi:MAG: hypothetical protein ACO36A_04795 [Ilumatobacteraceae bacterium]